MSARFHGGSGSQSLFLRALFSRFSLPHRRRARERCRQGPRDRAPRAGRSGCGVVGPWTDAGIRDAGLGVMRAPGSGVERGPLITRSRTGGGVYQAAAAAASFGHPFGSIGISALVVSWYSAIVVAARAQRFGLDRGDAAPRHDRGRRGREQRQAPHRPWQADREQRIAAPVHEREEIVRMTRVAPEAAPARAAVIARLIAELRELDVGVRLAGKADEIDAAGEQRPWSRDRECCSRRHRAAPRTASPRTPWKRRRRASSRVCFAARAQARDSANRRARPACAAAGA